MLTCTLFLLTKCRNDLHIHLTSIQSVVCLYNKILFSRRRECRWATLLHGWPLTIDRNVGGLPFSTDDTWTTDGNAGWAALRRWPLSHHKKRKSTVVRIVWAYFCGVQNNPNSSIHMKSGSCVALLEAGRTRRRGGVDNPGLIFELMKCFSEVYEYITSCECIFKNHWTAHLKYCISNYLYACISVCAYVHVVV